MTTLLVQSDRIIDNYKTFMRDVSGAFVIPVLSANAYGVGELFAARLLYEAGARIIAVTSLDSAIRLASEIKGIDVLLLTPYSTEEEIEAIVKNDIIATVGSYDNAVLLNGIAEKNNRCVRVHLKFNINRAGFGFLEEELVKAVQIAKYLSSIIVAGAYTEFTGNEIKSKKSAERHYDSFKSIIDSLAKEEIIPDHIYAVSDYIAIKYPILRFNTVLEKKLIVGRVQKCERLGYKRVGRLISKVIEVRTVPAKYYIGSDNRYKTRNLTKIALVPVGFSDGLSALSENEGNILSVFSAFRGFRSSIFAKSLCEINSKKVRVIGTISPDTVIADVSKIECSAGDSVSFDTDPIFISPAVRRSYV